MFSKMILSQLSWLVSDCILSSDFFITMVFFCSFVLSRKFCAFVCKSSLLWSSSCCSYFFRRSYKSSMYLIFSWSVSIVFFCSSIFYVLWLTWIDYTSWSPCGSLRRFIDIVGGFPTLTIGLIMPVESKPTDFGTCIGCIFDSSFDSSSTSGITYIFSWGFFFCVG